MLGARLRRPGRRPLLAEQVVGRRSIRFQLVSPGPVTTGAKVPHAALGLPAGHSQPAASSVIRSAHRSRCRSGRKWAAFSAPCSADLGRQLTVVKQPTHERAERGQVCRVRQQQTEAVVRNLVPDATYLTGNHRMGEPEHDAGHVLESVPSGDLRDLRFIRRAELDDVRAPFQSGRRTVEAQVPGRALTFPLEQAGADQYRSEVRVAHRSVLRRQRVEGGSDDAGAALSDLDRPVGEAGEVSAGITATGECPSDATSSGVISQ